MSRRVRDRFKRWFKLRFAILYPFGISLIIFANSDDASMMAGVWFVLAGLALRVWANGYAIKLEKLTTSGPYAFIRHPLYLGTMLILTGFIVILKIYLIGALFLVVMAVVYRRTVITEERMLTEKFKDAYADYKKKVPLLFPALRAYRGGAKWPFNFKRLIKSQEYKPVIWVIITVIFFYVKAEILMEHEKIDVKLIALIALAVSLGMVDLIGELLQWKKIKV